VALSVGDTIPNVKLMTITVEGLKPVESGDVLGQGKVVLFAVPGAFTPTCSDHHLPGYVMQADEILAKGVDRIACIAVNDPFVMSAWGSAQGTGDKIMMLADGNGEFAAQAGLELDLTGLGLGTRSQRYAAILQDGVVEQLFVETNPGGVDVSSADKVLKAL
jgi:glutaredoxin/glutathione-dependent peroxiredoxin